MVLATIPVRVSCVDSSSPARIKISPAHRALPRRGMRNSWTAVEDRPFLSRLIPPFFVLIIGRNICIKAKMEVNDKLMIFMGGVLWKGRKNAKNEKLNNCLEGEESREWQNKPLRGSEKLLILNGNDKYFCCLGVEGMKQIMVHRSLKLTEKLNSRNWIWK